MPVYSYDPPDRFVAGTVGQPGERTFYLQARSGAMTTSVALEKGQVEQLAERLDELLDEVGRRTGADVAGDQPGGSSPTGDDGPLDLPLSEDFTVGAIALAWDHDGERVIIEAQELTDEPLEPLSDDVPEDGPAILRVRITVADAPCVLAPGAEGGQPGQAAVPALRAAARSGRAHLPAAERPPGRAWLSPPQPTCRCRTSALAVAGRCGQYSTVSPRQPC